MIFLDLGLQPLANEYLKNRRIKDKKQRGEVKQGRKTIRKESDIDF